MAPWHRASRPGWISAASGSYDVGDMMKVIIAIINDYIMVINMVINVLWDAYGYVYIYMAIKCD